MRALSELSKADRRFQEGNRDAQAVAFWMRAVVRAFFALMEACGHTMRQGCLLFGEGLGLQVANKDRAKLAEKRYNREHDRLLPEARHLSSGDRLKLAFKFFPKLYGAAYVLDTGAAEWRGFRALVDARNRFTHPKTADDLAPVQMFATIKSTIPWALAKLTGMVAACAAETGYKQNVPVLTFPKFSDRDLNSLVVFDEETLRQISSAGASSLEYLRFMIGHLHAETRTSLQFLLETDGFGEAGVQFGVRNLVRCMFSNIEGLEACLAAFLVSAVSRGELDAGAMPAKRKNSFPVPVAFADTVDAFSRHFGNGNPVRRTGADWSALLETHKLRDRLTHPMGAEKLTITGSDRTAVLDAVGWFAEAYGHLLFMTKGSG